MLPSRGDKLHPPPSAILSPIFPCPLSLRTPSHIPTPQRSDNIIRTVQRLCGAQRPTVVPRGMKPKKRRVASKRGNPHITGPLCWCGVTLCMFQYTHANTNTGLSGTGSSSITVYAGAISAVSYVEHNQEAWKVYFFPVSPFCLFLFRLCNSAKVTAHPILPMFNGMPYNQRGMRRSHHLMEIDWF